MLFSLVNVWIFNPTRCVVCLDSPHLHFSFLSVFILLFLVYNAATAS